MNKKQKKILFRIIITIILLLLLHFIKVDYLLKLVLYFSTYVFISYDIIKKALKGFFNKRFLDENFLIFIASIGAFILAIYSKSNDYVEGVAVVLFYQIGVFFESYAIGKSRKSIVSLMDIRPDYANIEIDNEIKTISPEEIDIGQIIIVKPGEKVPIDGIIIDGTSSINTSALTGESIPVDVKIGDKIISGSININALLKIQTTKKFEDSTVCKILELVENASSKKSKSENFISRFAAIYTPVVCLSAFLVFILPPIFNILTKHLPLWNTWLYRALTFLVVSCPCALVISIPLSFFAGLGAASKEGILIKGSNYIERLSKIKYIVFDKTATLTCGTFSVVDIHHNTISKEQIIEYASLAESASTHPISKSIQKEYNKKIQLERIKSITEISGQGIIANIDNKQIACGNDKLMQKLNIPFKSCHLTGTIIHLAIDNEYAGHIVISDVIKNNSKKAIQELEKLGIKNIIMLTGDASKPALEVASKLNINTVYSNLLPNEKVEKLEEIISSKKENEILAFVGDGINDAPSLIRSDLGIAMGAMGSDAALEAADIVLMNDDPMQIIKAIKISKKCIGIVYQNIVFSLLVKFTCLILSALGISNMWFAIFADVGVMIIAVLNAMRALTTRKITL